MKVLVAVPSKGRANEIQKDTLRWLKKTTKDYRVFVEPQDLRRYVDVGIDERIIQRLSENNRGLGYAKKAIYEFAKANNYDCIFKVDDDVVGWYGADRKPAHEKSTQVFEQAIQDGVEAFIKYGDVKAISYPYSFQMFEVKKWSVNQRLQSCYFVRTEWLNSDERFSCFEDFATFILIRLNNGIVLRYGWAGIDCKRVGGNSGGCQSFNRAVQAREELKILQGLYPALKIKKAKGKQWEYEPDLNDRFFGGKEL